ncbi:MAG: hypothetical protein IJX38_06755 [Clostridia bacterium]|nr:hypothetical protein [Clostridia bacterium]
MCYFLYGAVDSTTAVGDYTNCCADNPFKLSIGTKHEFKTCVINAGDEFRVTDWICDCDFPIGEGDEGAPDLADLATLITATRAAGCAKHIYLSKTWVNKRNKKEVRVHIDDIDLIHFLANMSVNWLYCIDLTERSK